MLINVAIINIKISPKKQLIYSFNAFEAVSATSIDKGIG